MKIECSRKELHDALSLAGQAAKDRAALNILQTVRLDAQSSSLTLLGCDGEMWVEASLLANVEVPGKVCVSSALLSQVVGVLPEGSVQLQVDGTSLVLRQGETEWKMLGLPADDFPDAPTIEASSELTLSMGELRNGVKGVAYAVAEDSSRPQFTGVLFTYDGNTLTLVATDTTRLAVMHITREGIGSELSAVVPEKALRAIAAFPPTDAEEIKLRFDDTRIAVDAGNCKIVSQLLTGAFPNWQRVVPTEHTRTWTFDRQEMAADLKRALILARDNAFRVRFSGQPDKITIFARSEDKGEAKEEISAITNNGEIQMAFNCRFVLDALGALNSEGVKVELTEQTRPAVFRNVENPEGQYCVIMPMALT